MKHHKNFGVLKSALFVFVLPLLLLLGSTGCMQTAHFNGIEPVSPVPPRYFGQGTDVLGRDKDPSGIPTVDSVEPTLDWKAADTGATQYDLAICPGIGHTVSAAYTATVFEPGRQLYYREGIHGTSHHVETPLANNTVYVWSVRTRDGDTVGPWSTYNFTQLALGTSEFGTGLWWPFRTPAGVGDANSAPVAADSTQGRIYFFRNKKFVGSGMQTFIRIDGEPVGNSMNGGYFYVDRPAGTYVLACDERKRGDRKEITVTLAAGETIYIRTHFEHWGLVPTVEDATLGAKAISECAYMPNLHD